VLYTSRRNLNAVMVQKTARRKDRTQIISFSVPAVRFLDRYSRRNPTNIMVWDEVADKRPRSSFGGGTNDE